LLPPCSAILLTAYDLICVDVESNHTPFGSKVYASVPELLRLTGFRFKPVVFPNTLVRAPTIIGFACLGFVIYRKRGTDAETVSRRKSREKAGMGRERFDFFSRTPSLTVLRSGTREAAC
jgi:hypothetical protein